MADHIIYRIANDGEGDGAAQAATIVGLGAFGRHVFAYEPKFYGGPRKRREFKLDFEGSF